MKLKQVIQKNTLLASIKVLFIKIAITQLLMGLFEKFTYMTPRTPSTRKGYYFIPLKGPGSNGLRSNSINFHIYYMLV